MHKHSEYVIITLNLFHGKWLHEPASMLGDKYTAYLFEYDLGHENKQVYYVFCGFSLVPAEKYRYSQPT